MLRSPLVNRLHAFFLSHPFILLARSDSRKPTPDKSPRDTQSAPCGPPTPTLGLSHQHPARQFQLPHLKAMSLPYRTHTSHSPGADQFRAALRRCTPAPLAAKVTSRSPSIASGHRTGISLADITEWCSETSTLPAQSPSKRSYRLKCPPRAIWGPGLGRCLPSRFCSFRWRLALGCRPDIVSAGGRTANRDGGQLSELDGCAVMWSAQPAAIADSV